MTSTILAILIAAGSAQRYEGTLRSIDAKSGKILMLMNDHSTGKWTLAPNARVFGPDHKPSARGALRPGEQVQALVSEDGTVQTVWIVESDWGKEYQGGKVRRWDGRVVAIKKRSPLIFEIQQMSGAKRMFFDTTPATRYMRTSAGAKPEAGSADDIKDGAKVLVLLNTKDRKVYEVEIRE